MARLLAAKAFDRIDHKKIPHTLKTMLNITCVLVDAIGACCQDAAAAIQVSKNGQPIGAVETSRRFGKVAHPEVRLCV